MSAAAAQPRAFYRLWAGQAASQLGDYIALFAIPFYVVERITDNPLWFGRIFFAETIPALLLGIAGSVLVDRLAQRRLMITTDLFRAGLFAVLAVVSTNPRSVGPLVIAGLAFLLGSAATAFSSTLATYIPSLYPAASDPRIVDANSKLHTTQQLFFVIGPAISGMLIAGLGFGVAFSVNAATFLISAAAIRSLPEHRTPKGNEPRGRYFADLSQGIRFVMYSQHIRWVTVGGFVTNLVNAYVEAVLVLLSMALFGVSDAWNLSMVWAAFGVGGVLGAVISKKVTARIGIGRLFIVGMAIWGAGIGTATYLTNLHVALTMFAVAGFGLPWVAIGAVTIRQTLAPPEMLGRINATSSALIMSGLPIGAITLTWMASMTSVITVARIVPLLLVVTAAILTRTAVWQRRIGPEAKQMTAVS